MNAKNFIFPLAAAAVLAMVLVSLSPMFVASAEGTGVQLAAVRTRTHIDNSYAVTNLWVNLRNPSDADIEETFQFQIPDDAFISNFSLTLRGKTYYATVMEKAEADKAYQDAKDSGNNAGLVSSRGRSTFAYSVNVAARSNVSVGLRYEEFIARMPTGYRYSLPLSSFAGRTLDNVDVRVDIEYDRPILDLREENYPNSTQVQMDTGGLSGAVTYQSTGTSLSKDMNVTWQLEALPLNGRMLFYEDGQTGYFFHVFSPEASDLGGHMPKDVVFVLDKSGSMTGTKIAQLKDAFSSIVMELRSEDRFAILTFNSQVDTVYKALTPATDTNKQEAANKINGIPAGGNTNINQALLDGLKMFDGATTRVPMIVFLTDGLPTSGVTVTDTIRTNIAGANTMGVRIFVLGVGNDVDFVFLKALALENKGYALKISADRDASDQIQSFFDTVALPLLRDITLNYNPGSNVLPQKVDTLFDGSEIVVCGRYKPGTRSIKFEGTAISTSGTRTFGQEFTVQASQDKTFIKRYWSYAKIRDLTDKISVERDDKVRTSMAGEATDIALENGFVTPYTSLFVEIPDEVVSKPTSNEAAGGGPYDLSTSGNQRYKAATAPGFEMFLLLPALIIVALIIRKRREG